MGKITINLTRRDIPENFQNAFNGKTFVVKLKDAVLKSGSDDLKAPNDIKNGEKLAAMLKTFVKPFTTSVESLLDEATITSDVTGLGDHELEIKFKSSKSPSATLQLRDKDGKDTRVVIEDASQLTSVKIENEGDAVDATYQATVDRIIAELKKVGNWDKNHGVWTPTLPVRNHNMPSEGYWKAYVDEAEMGSGTVRRMHFTTEYIKRTNSLSVVILEIVDDH